MKSRLGPRVWDLPMDFNVKASARYYRSYVTAAKKYRFEEGVLVFYVFHGATGGPEIWIGTSTHPNDGDKRALVEPIAISDWETFWEPYILEDLDPEYLIDMKGEFDADDIELAEIFMEEMK